MRIRTGLLLAAMIVDACVFLGADTLRFAPISNPQNVLKAEQKGASVTEEIDREAAPAVETEVSRDLPPVQAIAPAPTLRPRLPEVDSRTVDAPTAVEVTAKAEPVEAPEPSESEQTPAAEPETSVPDAPKTIAPDPSDDEANEELLEAAPEIAYSVEHVDMIIEGRLVSVRSRHRDGADRQYNLTDIAEPLESRTELHETLLGYHRAQDGTLMSINMEDGKVRSNRTVLGRLPGFEPREVADPWIGLNAVTIMTGTHPSEDEQGRVVLTLDDQLKPQFGLELWVNGVLIDTFGKEPRTIGPILLVPLEPIVEALGHEMTVADGTVTVIRQQDQATINLELATGLISVNTTPRGITPDMQLAERDTLVLPFGAVESLTGTNIQLVPLTNRVEVYLDNRLDSTSLPGANIAEEARTTPLTLESLTYQLSDRGPLRVETRGHVGKYNFRTQFETAGGVDTLAQTQPGWASIDIVSLEGWNGTVGDYTSSFRELSGVGANRIRGLSWRKQRENGDVIAVAAGLPRTGSEVASAGVSVPSFGGFAAGGRLIAHDQSQDIGLSAAISEDAANAAIVANGQKVFRFEEKERGLQSAFVAIDLGAFTGDAAGADLRVRGSANYVVNSQIGVSANGSYDGAKFAGGAANPSLEGVFDQRNGARTNLSFGANWRADEPIAVFNRLSVSARLSARHQGGNEDGFSTSMNLAVNGQIGTKGPSVSAILQQSDQGGATNTSLRVRGVQRFDRGTVTASYTQSENESGEATQQFVATAQLNPIQHRFNNGASVQIAPNATLNWDGETTRMNAGASAVGNSGNMFGPKLNLSGRLSAFSNFSAEDEEAQSTRFLGSLEARYRLFKNAQLTAIYTDDFSGRSDLSVGLRSTMVFNPPRASRLPDDGKGVLNGRVFLDNNRDGIRQDDEPGIPGVRVMLIGTRVGLNTGANGYFTIQNVRQGLYAVTVSRESLPLGYLVPEGAQPRVTVGSGRRTDVEIPLILSGQVRGSIFIDDNANGAVDPGEKRLEGQWISLIPADGGDPINIHSASFGQYGFESVDPGTYTLQTTISGQPVRQEITVDGKNPFVVAPIPIPPDLADSGGGIDLTAGVIGEP